MNATEKEQLRSKIDRKLRIAREKISQLEEMTQPVTPENSIGRISRMDAINNKSVMEAALRTARLELEGLEYADRHLRDDAFGRCIDCGGAIDFRRLMFLPGSRLCMNCAR